MIIYSFSLTAHCKNFHYSINNAIFVLSKLLIKKKISC
jgi:hypothetical protein